MTRTITIHSTPICAPCKIAYKRLDAAGIPYEVIDLTEDAETLDALKKRLERPQINTPLIRWGTEYVQIDQLTRVINEYKEQEIAA